jgi:hypothetical protein
MAQFIKIYEDKPEAAIAKVVKVLKRRVGNLSYGYSLWFVVT